MMNKIAIPVLLVSIVMIAGIFAFMPIDLASTVHTTIQGTQLNNINMTSNTDLKVNTTASCGASGGPFMVYYTFVNDTADGGGPTGTIATTSLAIGDDSGTGGATTSIDFTVVLVQTNFTATSGFIGGSNGETITFSGTGDSGAEVGDLMVTVVCQSGSTPVLSP